MEFSLIFRNSVVMIGQIRRNPFRGEPGKRSSVVVIECSVQRKVCSRRGWQRIAVLEFPASNFGGETGAETALRRENFRWQKLPLDVARIAGDELLLLLHRLSLKQILSMCPMNLPAFGGFGVVVS